jgi:phage FluMu protein Com
MPEVKQLRCAHCGKVYGEQDDRTLYLKRHAVIVTFGVTEVKCGGCGHVNTVNLARAQEPAWLAVDSVRV